MAQNGCSTKKKKKRAGKRRAAGPPTANGDDFLVGFFSSILPWSGTDDVVLVILGRRCGVPAACAEVPAVWGTAGWCEVGRSE